MVLSRARKLDVLTNCLKCTIFLSCFIVIPTESVEANVNYVEHSSEIRVDCHPDRPVNHDRCIQRGCVWSPGTKELEASCFFPDGYGYHQSQLTKTQNGYNIDLVREPKNKIFGKEVDTLSLVAFEETSKRLRLKFVDKYQKRYEVPLEMPSPPSSSPESTDYQVDFVNKPQFGVEVKRRSTGRVLFDTNVPGMVFSDQFIQITTKLASSNIYGLGEHFHDAYQHSTNWKNMSFFARDAPPEPTSTNLYGVHPFYMNVEEDGNAHGVFLLNSNAMEVVIQPYPAITFRTIGGILDFYVFLGPTPEDVVKQYLEVIGLPLMPPYWSLGFQLSRWGYENIQEAIAVTMKMTAFEIPYDVQYFDIDYMDNHKDFTVDGQNFAGMKEYVDTLHSEYGIKLVVIVDPAIASDKSLEGKYPALDLGKSLDIFIKTNGTILEGNCWPGNVYYPDFSHPQALSYWTEMCSKFRELVPFDGLWIDVNEPTNFVAGSVSGCSSTPLNYPPYSVGVLGSEQNNSMLEKTICMDAEQHAGKHYDVHNLYGTFEANVTNRALREIIPGNLRPMIVSRSTFPGAGKYTTHWLGDNNSTWVQMRASIVGILEFNLFGFPFVGADICGFNGNVTEELCYRWMQLGAFYPFSRNHNAIYSKPQDPASLGDRVVKASRDALRSRYMLLPYLYTLFHLAHTEGSTVARPLLHEFPQDKNTWAIKYQFLWGPSLLISPILFEGAKSVDAYFPAGIWYDFHTYQVVKQGRDGATLTLKDEGSINLHVRGGSVLPIQQPDVNTAKSRENPMGLIVAPDESGMAKGLLFLDDGVSHETQQTNTYTLVEFLYKQESHRLEMSSDVKVNNYRDARKLAFSDIIICDQPPPINIVLNGRKLDTRNWQYDDETKVLVLKEMRVAVTKKFYLVVSN